MKPFLSDRQAVVLLTTALLLTGCSPPPQPTATQLPSSFPRIMPDPLEPLNRGINSVNDGLLVGAVRPTSKVYRKVVPEPGRKSVGNFAKNIGYPSRLLNNLLQGRWKGAGDETLRFLTNTTVGLGGLFDPATGWKIPESKATFSETFSKWGWEPHGFAMLPFFGPSDDVHVAEFVGDRALLPWYYYPELAPVGGVLTLNQVSERANTLARFVKTEPDSYFTTKYIWTYISRENPPNWMVTAPKHQPSLQTLKVAAIKLDDPEFTFKGRERKVRLSSTNKKMKFSYWLQKDRAPLVFIAPGLGSHRLSANTTSIAENLFQQGHSVVTIAGTFHPEFIENASTAAVPAYPPVDSHDLLTVLAEANQLLEKKYPGRFGKRALVGFSLGGFHTLMLAAKEQDPKYGALHFDRYVAINPPIDLQHGDEVFDDYFNAPRNWPESERLARIDNATHKAVLFPFLPKEKQADPPFDGIESKYLVGVTFRFVLRDAIYSSQRQNDLGVVKSSLSKWHRQAAYSEILGYSFDDYVNRFVLPYYATQGVSKEDFDREADLQNYQRELAANPKIRIITNKDDFLLRSRDISWLKSNFKRSQVKLLPTGGHLGNIATPEAQEALISALTGLKGNP